MHSCEIRNIKASLKLPVVKDFQDILVWCFKTKTRVKKFPNFLMIYLPKSARISVFKASSKKTDTKLQHWNITGVDNFSDLNTIVNIICDLVQVAKENIIGPTIDNISAKGKLSNQSSLILENCAKLCRDIGYSCRINREITSALHIKPSIKVQEDKSISGTVLLYSSGNYLLIGCKSNSDCEELTKFLENLTKEDKDV